MKRQGSSFHQFRKRVPADVAGKIDGISLLIPVGDALVPKRLSGKTDTVVVSLQTRDPVEAKKRHTVVAGYLDSVWDGIRSGPARLSQKQIVALAGEVYSDFISKFGENPGPPELWEEFVLKMVDAQAGTVVRLKTVAERRQIALRMSVGHLVDKVLMRHALIVDSWSYERLVEEVARAFTQAAMQLWQHASGDYSPDFEAGRFPTFESQKRQSTPMPISGKDRVGPTLTGLVKEWWAEARALGRKPSTHESYSNTMTRFVKLLGHDDAQRVTPEDVIRFKDTRLAEINPRNGKPISPKTVKGSDLAGLKVVFDWAVANRKLTSNPAADVTLKVAKTRRTRSKGFTDEEAKIILAHAFHHKAGREFAQTAAAKRWVPWLCAYSGARVGEIAQLRKGDVRHVDGRWIIHITPDAGTVKTDQARDVPIHSHLVEQGLVDFVQRAKDGPLFLIPAEGGDVLGPLQGVTNRLGEFVREVLADRGVAPNHGWRHRFKTVCRDIGVDPGVRDAIQGHAARTVAEEYGDVSLTAKAAAIEKLPRYAVD